MHSNRFKRARQLVPHWNSRTYQIIALAHKPDKRIAVLKDGCGRDLYQQAKASHV